MKSYQGKHIWIIGASTGIGRALAIELSAQGALLALSARSKDKLQSLKTELGGNHLVLPLDISDANEFVKAANTVVANFPKLDSAIIMAAIYDPAPLRKMKIKSVHQIINVNLNGMFNAINAVLPILKGQDKGQLALCGSVAGYGGLPNGQPYSASKAAVINLAESLRIEEPSLDIKLINPGFVKTPMTDKNDFNMPMMIEANEAAKIIAHELHTKRFEIHFPKRFTWIMKIINSLPYWLYFMITKRIKSSK